MIWREPAKHFNDCYFSMTNLVGYNKKNRKNILYPSIPSSTRPIPRSDEYPVPVFKELLDLPISAASLAPEPVPEELTENDVNPESLDNDNDIDYHECSSEPNRFNQDDLIDLSAIWIFPRNPLSCLFCVLRTEISCEPRQMSHSTGTEKVTFFRISSNMKKLLFAIM